MSTWCCYQCRSVYRQPVKSCIGLSRKVIKSHNSCFIKCLNPSANTSPLASVIAGPYETYTTADTICRQWPVVVRVFGMRWSVASLDTRQSLTQNRMVTGSLVTYAIAAWYELMGNSLACATHNSIGFSFQTTYLLDYAKRERNIKSMRHAQI